MNYELAKGYVSTYGKVFKRCGVNETTLLTLDRMTITETKTEMNGRKITAKNVTTVTAEYYANIVSGCAYFADRVTKSYTYAGYIATRFRAVNPFEKSHVIIREYRIEPKKKAA